MNAGPNFNSLRAYKARKALKLGATMPRLLQSGAVGFALLAAAIFIMADSDKRHVGFLAIAGALATFMAAVWIRDDLTDLPPEDKTLDGRLSGEVLGRLNPRADMSPQYVWNALVGHWQANFFLNRLLISNEMVTGAFSNDPNDMPAIWQAAMQYADKGGNPEIEVGHVIGALLNNTPGLKPFFAKLRFTPDEIDQVMAWLDRALEAARVEKPFFGGIGRDWSSGFTPVLNRFGHNLSFDIEHGGSQFGSLTKSAGVAALQSSFAQGSGAVALIGADGIGKTSHIYALAQLLLEGKVVPTLKYNQIISLNPSVIISSAQHDGELEQIVLTLLNEATHAGHIILFLDDAQLFFGEGTGSFDMTQILLPVVQSHGVRLILAMEPHDFQRLKTKNPAFANLLSPVTLTEQPESEVMSILEDTALGLEYKRGSMVSYEALCEAYRLSGRYDQEHAYPGKAIQLLEQSLTHGFEGSRMITAQSVQAAVEQARGVKVSSANQVEADALLHLEDAIHERMINQSRAVKVVASALRRARAGVSSTKRPIGSFLFLGPTGVGKTELAKAIAATYFGDEANMIRLDMSEYQQPDDVQRLLSNGEHDASLIVSVRQQPFTVLLLDEIEKAHPNILNLLLQLLDEGELTDSAGRPASFRDCVIIATSNAGASSIREHIERGEELEEFEKEFTDELINSNQFKPELLNRFDEIVLFRPLKPDELAQVVLLMLDGINKTLANQNISVELTPAAIAVIVEKGNDPRLGARPMRRMLQRAVEDGIAGRILRGETQPGDHVVLDAGDLAI